MVDILVHERRFVYGIKSLDLIKVGVAKNIEERLEDMRLLNPHGCELVFYRKVYAPFAFEKRMHELLADKAVGREWFRVTVAELRAAATKAKSRSLSAEIARENSKFLARIDTRKASIIAKSMAYEELKDPSGGSFAIPESQ